MCWWLKCLEKMSPGKYSTSKYIIEIIIIMIVAEHWATTHHWRQFLAFWTDHIKVNWKKQRNKNCQSNYIIKYMYIHIGSKFKRKWSNDVCRHEPRSLFCLEWSQIDWCLWWLVMVIDVRLLFVQLRVLTVPFVSILCLQFWPSNHMDI